MDFENIVGEYDREQANRPVVLKATEFKTIYLAPSTDVPPDDGILAYVGFESIFDLAVIADRSVLLVRYDQLDMVKCCLDAAVYLEINFAVLTGLPGAEYSQSFEEVTWRLDKYAYAPFITELRLATDLAAQVSAQSGTVYDDEKARYTRKSGGVKPHTGYTVHGADDPDEIGDEELVL